MQKTYKIEISAKTIVFTVIFLLFLKSLWLIRELLFSFLIAFIMMSAIKPVVVFLEKKGLPRLLSTIIIFVVLIFFLSYALFIIVPLLVIQLVGLIKNLPLIIEGLSPSLIHSFELNSLSQYLPDLTNQIFNLVKNLFSNAVFIISTLFFSFYFTLEENFIQSILIKFLGEKEAKKISLIFASVERRLGAWFWGEIFLMFIVGFLTFIGLSLIGIKYALPLAFIAGLLEIVPNLGPTISTIPSFLVALNQSFFLSISVIALYFLIQQVENNIIVPQVMKKAVGLNPIITLTALIIGGKIGGIVGVLLAVPITLFIETVLIEILKSKNSP
ncbi:MAG: AI-2E family transporter [Microgenomates group bacterium]|nr:AI-2E family transporter [Microgenomates group bacterium]